MGRVVPELAAKHLELLPFVLEEALAESKIKIRNDYIASTVAPGLVGCFELAL